LRRLLLLSPSGHAPSGRRHERECRGAGSFQFNAIGVQKWNIGTASDYDIFYYNNGGTNTYNLWIDYATGNLGLGGTTTPDEKLELEWSANVDIELGVGTTDTDITFIKLRSPDGTPYWLYPANGGGSLTISATKP